MNAHYEVVVVGSGAGGGVIAGELADAGRRVLLLEAGPYRTAADYMRWEAHANHDMWWPLTFAEPAGEPGPPMPLFRGRLVGGTTSINTKVALRPFPRDYAKWHAAAGLLGDSGEPFAEADLLPYLKRVEERLGVRERTDWQKCVHTVVPGFEALEAPLKPVRAYTDHNCMRCGSCLQGCPTNAGKNTQNTWIQPALVEGRLELRANCTVRRVTIEDRGDGPEATGVEYGDAGGALQTVHADVVVVAGGALATPGLLIRSGVREAARDSSSSRLIGRNLGFHAARIVQGLFDEVQDAHMVYPITAHCLKFAQDEDGGFAVEASTLQDPIGFSTALCDENDAPLWGEPLVEAVRKYRHYIGLLTMITDENNGTAVVDDRGRDRFTFNWNQREQERLRASLEFARRALELSGAQRVLHTGPVSTHVQGSCRMGNDPERSVVNAHGESHDVRRLFVGDGSVVPRTLSVNPSLTIMALACRLAHHLDAGEHGYLSRATVAAAV
ncbi:MAG: GMC family oxidoreductase [Solirubrobacterales bacterium]|nr:GMC family oxidoreductase [Solirubrobacterales bacterium]MBV9714601.1 GMC family oxidoreductase [Solirubrobacterales bacterium]